MTGELITFEERLGGVITIEREQLIGIRIPNIQIIEIKIILKSGAQIRIDCSYEYAMKTIQNYDAKKRATSSITDTDFDWGPMPDFYEGPMRADEP